MNHLLDKHLAESLELATAEAFGAIGQFVERHRNFIATLLELQIEDLPPCFEVRQRDEDLAFEAAEDRRVDRPRSVGRGDGQDEAAVALLRDAIQFRQEVRKHASFGARVVRIAAAGERINFVQEDDARSLLSGFSIESTDELAGLAKVFRQQVADLHVEEGRIKPATGRRREQRLSAAGRAVEQNVADRSQPHAAGCLSQAQCIRRLNRSLRVFEPRDVRPTDVRTMHHVPRRGLMLVSLSIAGCNFSDRPFRRRHRHRSGTQLAKLLGLRAEVLSGLFASLSFELRLSVIRELSRQPSGFVPSIGGIVIPLSVLISDGSIHRAFQERPETPAKINCHDQVSRSSWCLKMSPSPLRVKSAAREWRQLTKTASRAESDAQQIPSRSQRGLDEPPPVPPGLLHAER